VGVNGAALAVKEEELEENGAAAAVNGAALGENAVVEVNGCALAEMEESEGPEALHEMPLGVNGFPGTSLEVPEAEAAGEAGGARVNE